VIDGYKDCAILYIYNESLELNPEKPEGGERRADGNISIKQSTGAKSRKNQKKEAKSKKNGKIYENDAPWREGLHPD
jgi:hypothetical protein